MCHARQGDELLLCYLHEGIVQWQEKDEVCRYWACPRARHWGLCHVLSCYFGVYEFSQRTQLGQYLGKDDLKGKKSGATYGMLVAPSIFGSCVVKDV